MRSIVVLSTLVLTSIAAAQEARYDSGPKVGANLPRAFDCHNINGSAKGRPHCVVCDFGRRPSVLIFAREPAEGKEGPLHDLLKNVDDALDKYKDQDLRGAVIFLSPDARSSASEAPIEDPAKLVEEAKLRTALLKRLAETADKLKNVIVATYPIPSAKELEADPKLAFGPREYQLHPKADVTVLFYDRMKVLANGSYAEGKLRNEDAELLLKQVREHFAPEKR